MKSWNEIRKAATAFSKRWKDAYDEKSQAQSFLKEFFAVFGVDAVTVATFEHRVKFVDGSQGYIDCFWPGKILVEMKSRGKDLDAAFEQAMDYVRSLPDASQMPRAIVVSDFARVRFYDLSRDCALTEFALKDLRKCVTLFGYMIGAEESGEIREQNPVNRKAAEKMAALHDAMKAVGYTGHPLEVYLVRLLFCLFAEDTGIFKPNQFCDFIKSRTAEDGRDLAPQLALLFDTLNREQRLVNLDETIAAFPYVNGGLFAEPLPMAAFSAEMRDALLDCAALDWSKISPAIFGAMFQGVMDEQARHDLGAHYTSEENILKLIRPLFLDSLRAEFDAVRALKGKAKEVRFHAFHDKIAALTFLDPACGCGNFLLIAYRELRRLEMDVLEELHRDSPERFLDVSQLCKVSVSQFSGLEIEPFPAEIAKVALWLMDHLCNLEVADRFGQYFARIPIKDSPHIVCANALTTDWGELLAAKNAKSAKTCFDYIMGNPPFLGAMRILDSQRQDMALVFGREQKMLGELDLVTAWFKKASDLIQGTATKCALVATNSITQGQQATALWPSLNIEIDFAYRTFKWRNEAKGNAAVHCVIIGLHAKSARAESAENAEVEPSLRILRTAREKIIYDSDGMATPAAHINGYLMDAPDIVIASRSKPLCDVPPMNFGNMPRDGGNLIIEADEYEDFVRDEPQAAPFIRPLLGAEEFLHGLKRYCIWLVDADLALLHRCPKILDRVEKCRQMRLASKAAATRKFAATPGLFCQITQPEGKDYIAIPRVSSERREYIPIGFLTSATKVTDLLQIIPGATRYHFGVLTSRMHMAWMRAVAGRLEMRYRYSKDIVYNNFVWPDLDDSAPLGAKIAAAARAVLDARAAHPGATLADLYDPLTMPPELVKAHAHLDALVDKAYGLKPSATDSDRVALLFKLYAEKTAA
ncbi:MAG: DNA methyltransferase [Kiritimatiellia bacterium]